MKDREMVILLDSVDEALIGALAKQNGVSEEEQLRQIISAALAEIARSKMDQSDLKRH